MLNIDNVLIKAASDGDMASFEEIYKVTSGFVYNVALRITNNVKDAEEVTQDVFVKVYNNIKRFEFRSSFTTWLYRIAVNTALNFKKSISRNKYGRVDYETVSNIKAAKQEGNIESEDEVKFLLNKLSPEHRVCVVLRDIEGLSYKEISDVLKININTVRSRLNRARDILMKYARKEVVENEMR